MLLTVAGAGTALAQAPAWVEAGAPAGRYSILMPGNPKPGSVPIPLPGGRQATMYTSTFETPNVVFFASYLDYPSDIVAGLSTEALLDRVRNGHLQNRKMRSGRPITMAGHPGRELVAETQDGAVLVIRSLFVGPRLYQCIVEGRPGVENDPDTRKFLESFALR